jgi:hypothetical protein
MDGILTTFYGAAAKPLDSRLLGVVIGVAMTVGLGYVIWAWVKPSFAHLSLRRLQLAAASSGLVAVAATVIALLPFRGARDPLLETIVPLAVLVLNLGFALFAGLLFELADRDAQLRTRAYLAAVTGHAALGLFLQELRRKLREHPFNQSPDDDDPEDPGQAVACLLVGVLTMGALFGLPLMAFADTLSFNSGHFVADSTGSVDRLALRSTVEIVIRCLPDFVNAFSLRQVEVSGWSSGSPWGPPTTSFDMPGKPLSDEPAPKQMFLGSLFPGIKELESSQRSNARTAAQAKTDSVWLRAVEEACASGPAPLLRQLAEAPRIPETPCSPVNDLFARCSYDAATRLNVLLIDGIDNCDTQAIVPASSKCWTIVILLPGKGEEHRSVAKMIEDLHSLAPWLVVVPALELDHGGLWVSRLKALLESRSRDQVGIAP